MRGSRVGRFFVLAALLIPAPVLRAQDVQDGWFLRQVRSFSRKLTTPRREFNPEYVYQLDLPWVVSLDGDLIHTGFGMQSDITPEGPDGPGSAIHASSHLREKMSTKLGGGITYGTLCLSNTVEIGPNRALRNKYTRFSLSRPRFGLSFQYYRINDFLDGTIHYDAAPGTDRSFSSQLPGRLRTITADVFYFFNPDRFAYSAVTSLNVIQRRSGGSWMATVRYNQGEFRFDPKDDYVRNSYDHIGCYRTGEISLGGGYSYNWVPLHRSPEGRGVKGLRNLTFNGTLVPGLTFYNHLHTIPYKYADPEQAEAVEGKIVRSHTYGLPGINISARAGVIFSWDRYFLCSIVTFNRYHFKGVETVTLDEQTRERYRTLTGGVFYDISARVQLNVRF